MTRASERRCCHRHTGRQTEIDRKHDYWLSRRSKMLNTGAHSEMDAAAALVAAAPLAARWIDRLLAAHDPPLTTPQYLALRAISREQVTVNEAT